MFWLTLAALWARGRQIITHLLFNVFTLAEGLRVGRSGDRAPNGPVGTQANRQGRSVWKTKFWRGLVVFYPPGAAISLPTDVLGFAFNGRV